LWIGRALGGAGGTLIAPGGGTIVGGALGGFGGRKLGEAAGDALGDLGIAAIGTIPDQDFGNGITWPPRDKEMECRIEVPPPKLPPPQKPDCETVFQVCKNAVKMGTTSPLARVLGYGSCLSAYAICRRVIGGGH
jgi:hypothetical protein